jgi:hypothetical protein
MVPRPYSKRVVYTSKPNTSPRFRYRFDKNQGFVLIFWSLRYAPASAPLKRRNGDAVGGLIFTKQSNLFVPLLCPRFAFLQLVAPAVVPLILI